MTDDSLLHARAVVIEPGSGTKAAALRRVEMHLVAREAHRFHVAGERFEIALGESIHTENAHKYEPQAFAGLAADAGILTLRHWTDEGGRFAVLGLAAPDAA